MRSPKMLNRSFGLLFVFLLFVSCQAAPTATPIPVPPTPTAEPTRPSPATAVLNPAKLLYAGEGQYKVGSQDFVLQDADETLYVYAFYPGLDAAAPDTAHGPYPLVVYSPGLSASPLNDMNWLGPIASHGFVILSSLPRGETIVNFWAGSRHVRRISGASSSMPAS